MTDSRIFLWTWGCALNWIKLHQAASSCLASQRYRLVLIMCEIAVKLSQGQPISVDHHVMESLEVKKSHFLPDGFWPSHGGLEQSSIGTKRLRHSFVR